MQNKPVIKWEKTDELNLMIAAFLRKEGKNSHKYAPIQRGAKAKNTKFRLIILYIIIFAVSMFVGFSRISPVMLLLDKDFALSGSLIMAITIMYASVLATMIGLCVTAFIFLNDTLKNRVESDETLRSTVNDVFKVYSYKLKQLAVGTAVVIVFIVMLNVFGKFTDSALGVSTWEFKSFVALSVLSIAFVVLIILFSCEITYSDKLLREQAMDDYNDIRRVLGHIVDYIKGKIPKGLDVKDKEQLKFETIRDDYNISMVYVQCFSGEFKGDKKDEKNSESDEKARNKKKDQIDNSIEEKGRYTRFLRDMGYIETVIEKICLNNINDSITASDSKFESMKIGFEWLYSERKGDAYYIDVRDEHRYLDFIKYCIIVDRRFHTYGYDNDAIEEKYDEYLKDYRELPTAARKVNGVIDRSFDSKGGRIIAHKENLRLLIENFFSVFEVLYMYKNALIHIEATDAARKMDRSFICPDENAEKLVEVLKTLVNERFTSFVKINDVNLGNSNVRKGWFNHTVFNDSNFTCSDFELARLEYTVMRNCDLSTSKLLNADASDSDLTGSNLNYSNLIGVDFTNAILTKAQMSNVVFRDAQLDRMFDKVKKPTTGIVDEELARQLSMTQGNEISLVEFLINGALREEKIDEGFANKARRRVANWHTNKENLKKCLEREDWKKVGCNENAVLNAVKAVKVKIDSAAPATEVLGEMDKYLTTFNLRRATRVIDDMIYQAIYLGSRNEHRSCHKFRRENFGRVHFRIAKLKNATIDEVSLNNVDFSHVDMRFVSFVNSDLSSSVMHYTKARGADFTNCNLRANDIHKADLADAVFSDASLVHTIISNSNLQNVSLRGAVMLNCIIINTEGLMKPKNDPHLYFQLTEGGINVESYQLLKNRYGFDLDIYDLGDSDESEAPRRKRAFAVHSDWSNAVATEAILIGIDMDSSIFEEATFKRAALINNSMRWGNFKNAVFSEALITCCSFHQSNLKDVDFSNARLYDCKFTDCCLQNVNMIGAIFDGVDFTNCDLRNANLSNALFRNCTFDYAILDDTTVIGTRCDVSNPIGATWKNKKGKAESGFFTRVSV